MLRCHWCAGRGTKFGDICLVCAGAGILVPNPRPYEVTFTFFADEVLPARQFLAGLDRAMIRARTGSQHDADKVQSVLSEIRAELDEIKPGLADFDVCFSRYPDPPRG